MQYGEFARPPGEMLHQQFGDGDFVFGRFGQRNADRIADAVGHQRPDAHGALDAPLDAVSGLGNAQMNRIVHIFGVHRFDQETIGGDHDPRIARLHRHDDLIEPLRLADPQKLHRRDDHALRRIAPAVENALRERPVIDTDAQCDAPLAALGDQRLQLAVIRTVIARIDAHLVDIFRGDGGDLRHEVDVGDDRRVETVLTHSPYNVCEVLALAAALRRETHDPASGTVDPLDLGRAGFGIVGVGIGHRLYGDRMPAADHDPPDAHFAARTAAVFRKIHNRSRLQRSGPHRPVAAPDCSEYCRDTACPCENIFYKDSASRAQSRKSAMPRRRLSKPEFIFGKDNTQFCELRIIRYISKNPQSCAP